MVPLVSRQEWNARPADSFTVTNWGVRDAFVTHYSAGPPTQTMRQIQDFHMDVNGWSDIGYNLAVDVNGVAYEGRGWNRVPAATKDHNSHTVACLFIGSNQHVTDAAKRTIRALYDEACSRKGAHLLMRCHSDYNPTACPGDNLRQWVHGGMRISTSSGGDDGMIKLIRADGSPKVFVTNIVWKRWVQDEDQLAGLVALGIPQHVWRAEDVDAIPDATDVPVQLLDLFERPPVAPAPVDLAEFTAAFSAALDDPAIRAKLIGIVNTAEDS